MGNEAFEKEPSSVKPEVLIGPAKASIRRISSIVGQDNVLGCGDYMAMLSLRKSQALLEASLHDIRMVPCNVGPTHTDTCLKPLSTDRISSIDISEIFSRLDNLVQLTSPGRQDMDILKGRFFVSEYWI